VIGQNAIVVLPDESAELVANTTRRAEPSRAMRDRLSHLVAIYLTPRIVLTDSSHRSALKAPRPTESG